MATWRNSEARRRKQTFLFVVADPIFEERDPVLKFYAPILSMTY